MNIAEQRIHWISEAVSGVEYAVDWALATGERVVVWGHGAQPEGLPRNCEWLRARTLGQLRRGARAVLAERGLAGAPLTLLGHNGAGIDQLKLWQWEGMQRILLFNRVTASWQRQIRWQLRHTGKLIVSPRLGREKIRETLGWIPARHIGESPWPLPQDCGGPAAAGGAARGCVGVWVQGGWRRHGNRLRQIADRSAAAGLRLQVIVEGGRRVPGWARAAGVEWHSGAAREARLARARGWDSAFLLNDYEMESGWLAWLIGNGTLPIVPDGEAAWDAWSAEGAPRRYPWGDVDAAREIAQHWARADAAVRAAFRAWGQRYLAQRSGAAFVGAYESVVAAMEAERIPKLGHFRGLPNWLPTRWWVYLYRMRGGE